MRYILHTPHNETLPQGMVVIQDDGVTHIWTCVVGQTYRKHSLGTVEVVDQYIRSLTVNHTDRYWREVKRCAANRWMRDRGITT